MVKEEVLKKLRQQFELSKNENTICKNENTMYKNLWDVVKLVHREKYIALAI